MVDIKLLATIRSFCRQTRTSPTEFGLLSVGDPNLAGDLKAGREVRMRTRKRIDSFLQKRRRKLPRAKSRPAKA